MANGAYADPVTTDEPFQESIGFLLSQVGVLATRAWLDVLAARGLTPHHHAILLTLDAAGAQGVTDLAGAALIDPRNIGPVLAPLEHRGHIVRGDDPADRRRRVITLTATGRAVAKELRAATDRIEDDLLAPLGPDQRAVLRDQLRVLWRHAKGVRD